MPIENEIKLILDEDHAPGALHLRIPGLSPVETLEIGQAYLSGRACVAWPPGGAATLRFEAGRAGRVEAVLTDGDRDALIDRAGGRSEGFETELPARSARVRRQTGPRGTRHAFAFKLMTAHGLVEVEAELPPGLLDALWATTERVVSKTRSVYLHAPTGLKVEADAIRHPSIGPTLNIVEVEYDDEHDLAPVLADLRHAWLIHVEASDRRFDNAALSDPDHLAAMIALAHSHPGSAAA